MAESESEEVESSTKSSIESEKTPETSGLSKPDDIEVESNTEKSTVPEEIPEPESSFERENGQSEVEASAEKLLEVESDLEPVGGLEHEKSQSEVEAVLIASAPDDVVEVEIALILPVEPTEDDPPDLAKTREETELTNSSPQSDETATRPAHKEGVAPVPGQTAVPESAPSQEAAPALPFDPPMAAELLAADPPTPERTTAEKVAAALKARGVDAEQSPFSVFVGQVYDGPLDLLLDLIRKQDIDIYDIPIAKITAQFLAYVDHLRAGDMDVAGDFIYTAALLIHIKSKMLLPRAPVGPEESTEDPRRELVDRLLEHERFKNAAQMLHDKQMLEAATWSHPGVREFREDAGAEPEIAADTTDLVRIFRDILDRARNRPILNVEEDSVTVGQMIQFLTRRLTMEDKPVALRRLLSHTHSERALIAMFLGLLELVRLQAILLRQDREFSEIFVKKNTGFDVVVNEGLASAHDDWR